MYQLVFPSAGDGHEAYAEDGVENPGAGRWWVARRQRESTTPASTEIVSPATTDAASVPANQRSDTKAKCSRRTHRSSTPTRVTQAKYHLLAHITCLPALRVEV